MTDKFLCLHDCADQLAERALGVAVQHPGVLLEEERVFDSGESFSRKKVCRPELARLDGRAPVWQLTFSAPLSIASGCLGFALYGQSGDRIVPALADSPRT